MDVNKDISSLAHLKKLTISANNLLSIGELPIQLEFLNISYNKICDLQGISELANLRELIANNNEIKFIDGVQEAKNLYSLNLDNNTISDISGIQQLQYLNLFSVQNNKISDIRQLTAFAPLQMLSCIKLQGNPILRLDCYPQKVAAIMPYFKMDYEKGILTKGKKCNNNDMLVVNVEDEYFSDSTYKSLESTLKSNLGDTVNAEETEAARPDNLQEPNAGNIHFEHNKIPVPKLNLKPKLPAFIKLQQNETKSNNESMDKGETSFHHDSVQLNKKKIVIPKLNLNNKILYLATKVLPKKSNEKNLNASVRTCESSKKTKIDDFINGNSIREKIDFKTYKTHSSHRSVYINIG